MTPGIKRIPTGVIGFDDLVQGGFKEGSVNLVAGGPGSGKTIFAIQFLMEGLVRGEPGVYVTFEERKDKLYEDMIGFGWDLEKYEKEGKFAFLEYTPEQVKKVLIEGGGTIDTLVSDMKIKRMVIDSITSFTLLYKDELTQKESSLALFELINNWGCTAVLTSQDEEPDGSTITAALEFEVDSIILLYHFRKKGTRVRAIEILKMRGTKHPEKTFCMDITTKGLKVQDKVCEI
ncbi:MAG: ATPase domain-containing protein [archaeon]